MTVLCPFGISGKSTVPLRGTFQIVLPDTRELRDQFWKGLQVQKSSVREFVEYNFVVEDFVHRSWILARKVLGISGLWEMSH